MKNFRIIIMVSLVLFPLIVTNTHAAVTDLYFGYGKSTSPTTLPTTWVTNTRPESISNQYQLHQESFNFNSEEYVYFQIGLGNIDLSGSVFIDKIELDGPSGPIPIFNSGFENGTSGWSAWGSYNVTGEFSISSDAYEGASAAKLTVSGSGQYLIHGQVPINITQSGDYTLSVYTKVYEAIREIPPDDIFAMEIGNQWIYDSNIKRQVTNLDSTTFHRDTFEMTILENGIQIGKEWYEVWEGYLRYWGVNDYEFDFGLLVAWFPISVGDHKESMAWVLNYGTTVDLKVDVLGKEMVTLAFDTLEAYRLRYEFKISGPGGTEVTSYDWWVVPYIGVVRQQTPEGTENLVSFLIGGGTITLDTDTDSDGLKDYRELAVYTTDPNNPDTDGDGVIDGDEVNTHGTDPLDADTDDDGLNDGDEVNTHGTDPLDADTDDDGLNDGDEVNTYGTDPINPDTDDDGLNDGDEIARGTDPLDPDTDADQLPDGWEVEYRLDPLSSLPPNGAADDPDGDGLTNLEEFNLGRHPTNVEPDTPTLLSPDNGGTGVSLTPQLQTNPFSDGDGDAHAKTRWQVSRVQGDFSDSALVIDALTNPHLTSFTLPYHLLSIDTPYYWRAKFHDDRNASSEWSDEWSFQTVITDPRDPNGDGVPEDQEMNDPNVDLDKDGTADMNQADMKCVNSIVGGAQVSVKQGTNVVSIDSLSSVDPATISDTQNRPDEMPVGLTSFRLTVNNPGDTAEVTIYFSKAVPAKWYKWNPVNGWQDYTAHATFSADRTSVTLQLTDGGDGDLDGTANGVIIDPSGPGAMVASQNILSGGGGGGGCLISTVAHGFRGPNKIVVLMLLLGSTLIGLLGFKRRFMK